MAVSDNDLLLVQRGTTPFKTTADELASYSNTKIELGAGKDVPIASASQLGVIKVGTNLDIQADGTLSATVPAGLEYKGPWADASNAPTATASGQFWIWDAATATLNSSGWGTANGDTVNEGDRIYYDGGTFTVIGSGGGGGLVEITGTAPVVVSAIVDGEQDVSMPEADSSTDGYMSKEAFAKLDGIDGGAEANVNPTQSFTPSSTNGVLTLVPGGDTTTVPAATTVSAGLMTADDKNTLDNLVASPGGVLSLVAGVGIDVNTASAPGTAGTPQINAKFHLGPGQTADGTTLVMPANIQLLDDLP